MGKAVDFQNVSVEGLESSPVSTALAGLRANEARYYNTKYKHEFTVSPASEDQKTVDYVNNILLRERNLKMLSKPLETSSFTVENMRMTYVFYESGPCDQRDVLDRRCKEAGGRVQAIRGDGSARRVGSQVQVRQAEIKTGRDHSRFILCDQRRVLINGQTLWMDHLVRAPRDNG